MSDSSKTARGGPKRASAMIRAAQGARGAPEPPLAKPKARPAQKAASEPSKTNLGSPAAGHAHPASDVSREFLVSTEREGQRLDNFLMSQLKGVPKSLFYRLLRQGAIRVDGKRVKPEHKLVPGTKVHVPAVRSAAAGAPILPPSEQLDWLEARILHEDERLLVLDKPVGLASHGGSGLSYGAIEAMRVLRPRHELELIHRLDRDTSGLLMFAKKRSALREVQRLIKEGQTIKEYQLLVHGRAPRDAFEVRAPLAKNLLSGGERVVRVDADGKDALTRFRVVRQFANFTQLRAQILTGRTHQIRVHAQTAGLPIVGDRKYGNPELDIAIQKLGFRRMALHAWQLQFELQQETMRFGSGLPAEWQALLEQLD